MQPSGSGWGETKGGVMKWFLITYSVVNFRKELIYIIEGNLLIHLAPTAGHHPAFLYSALLGT
jgi:hypothetical protein